VSTHVETAFSALAELNPADRSRSEAADVEEQIALIVAVPRMARRVHDTERHHRGHRPCSHNRPRYGAFGLAASACIAVVASLLWVSPSAGAPTTRADQAQARVSWSGAAGSGPLRARAAPMP
jgi:hypothetical protein